MFDSARRTEIMAEEVSEEAPGTNHVVGVIAGSQNVSGVLCVPKGRSLAGPPFSPVTNVRWLGADLDQFPQLGGDRADSPPLAPLVIGHEVMEHLAPALARASFLGIARPDAILQSHQVGKKGAELGCVGVHVDKLNLGWRKAARITSLFSLRNKVRISPPTSGMVASAPRHTRTLDELQIPDLSRGLQPPVTPLSAPRLMPRDSAIGSK